MHTRLTPATRRRGKRVPLTAALLAMASLLFAGAASGIQFRTGNLDGNFDTTISYGLGLRVSDRDPDLIGRQNGGNAHSINGDDGNLNYNNGDVYSNSLRASFEGDLRYNDFTLFTRFFTFYDFEVMDGETQRTPLSSGAKNRIGRDFRLLDLYAGWSKSFDSGFIDLRGG